MRIGPTISAAITAALLAGLVLSCGGSSATASESFPEYQDVQEVPVVGSLKGHEPRVGPPPSRSAVRLATHYLRIARESSNVRCHGIPGHLIACRVHITGSGATIAARLTLMPEGKFRDLIIRCETTRLISGRLSEATCFDFTVWSFNKWQGGPPRFTLATTKMPAAKARKPPPPKAWTTRAETREIGDAWLNGAINPRGIPTGYHFQYGLTKSYGRIATGTRGTYGGNKRYAVGAAVFELRPGAIYHFRVVAVSKGGKTYGADKTFTTIKSRPKSGAVMACYHEKVRRYTALAHPGRCILRGYRGKQTVGIPIESMKWGHWGVFATRAAFGVDMRNGEHVRVVASRPITCDDGSIWYSKVGGVFLRHVRGFEFRLPTCVAHPSP